MQEKGRILVVEDEPVNRRFLVHLLEKEGFRVLTAHNGEEALGLAESDRPDLILLDIILPGMDGFATCQAIKNITELAQTAIIFISSLEDVEDKVKGFAMGGVDYITKPFQPAEVLARIRTHLRLLQLQRQLERQNASLAKARKKSESLLLNVLPRRIACELMETGCCQPRLHPEVTVCFADIVGFTERSSRLTPPVLIGELNDLFTAFDDIGGRHRCERLKTIGDAYFFASGIPTADPRHAHHAAEAALAMIDFLEQRNRTCAHRWQLRVGMHSGAVIGGVVGTEKYLYDIFGDTVNIAARMEEHADPQRILVSARTKQLLETEFTFDSGQTIDIKGKGQLMTYHLLGSRR